MHDKIRAGKTPIYKKRITPPHTLIPLMIRQCFITKLGKNYKFAAKIKLSTCNNNDNLRLASISWLKQQRKCTDTHSLPHTHTRCKCLVKGRWSRKRRAEKEKALISLRPSVQALKNRCICDVTETPGPAVLLECGGNRDSPITLEEQPRNSSRETVHRGSVRTRTDVCWKELDRG